MNMRSHDMWYKNIGDTHHQCIHTYVRTYTYVCVYTYIPTHTANIRTYVLWHKKLFINSDQLITLYN